MQKTEIILNFMNKLTPAAQHTILKELLEQQDHYEQQINTYKKIINNNTKIISKPKMENTQVDRQRADHAHILPHKQLTIETIDRNVESFDISEAARELNRRGLVIGSRRLYQTLAERYLIYKKNSSYYLPHKKMIDNGYMIADQRTSIKKDGRINKYAVVLITHKGINFLLEILKEDFKCII